jgi:hypothetical protein
MRLLLVLGFASLLATCPSPGFCAESPDGNRSVLREAPGLQASITVERPFATLGEVLEEVSAATQTPLRVTAPLRNDNVTVLAREKPAAELLEVLATSQGYRWRAVQSDDKQRPGYELYEDGKDRQKRSDRLRAARRAGLEEIRKECLRRAGYATIPPEQTKQRLQELDGQLRGTTLEHQQRIALTDEQKLLRARPNSTEASLLEMAARLLPSLTPQLATGTTVRFSTVPRVGMDSLPAWMASRPVEARLASPNREDASKAWLVKNRQRLEVRWQCQVRWQGRKVGFAVRDLVLGPPRPEYSPDSAAVWFTVPLPVAELPEPPPAKEAALDQPVKFLLAKRKPTPAEPLTCYATSTLMDLLQELHRQQPALPIVGDAYLHPLEYQREGKPIPLRQVLDRGTTEVGSSWRWDPRGYVVVRSRTPDLDRVSSIPAAVIRTLAERVEPLKSEGLGLDDYVWLAQQLSDEQIRTYFQVLPPGPTLVFPHAVVNRDTLLWGMNDFRLLGRLSDQQRLLLTQGQRLLGKQLSPLQLQFLGKVLNERDDWAGASAEIEFRTNQDLAAIGIRFDQRVTPPGPNGEPKSTSLVFFYSSPAQPDPIKELRVTVGEGF